MGRYYHSVSELIGHTPLLELTGFERANQLPAKILAKLEYLNPVGSSKDRTALALLDQAEADGRLQKGMTIIEPSQGNLAISLATLAVARGYHFVVVVPETCKVERRKLFVYLGAEIVLTDGALGMRGAIAKAHEMAAERTDVCLIDGFRDQANPKIHKVSTGLEIWNDTSGKVDIFVAGIGTGGTITGVGEYLKLFDSSIQVVAVEPARSPVLTKGEIGVSKIKGIGASFIPAVLNTSVYDEVIDVEDEDAYQTTRQLVRTDGIMAGISSGAVAWACAQLAMRPENKGKTIVTIFADSAERYINDSLFEL